MYRRRGMLTRLSPGFQTLRTERCRYQLSPLASSLRFGMSKVAGIHGKRYIQRLWGLYSRAVWQHRSVPMNNPAAAMHAPQKVIIAVA